MTIKNIVLSGGGPPALISYGIIKQLDKSKYIDLTKINKFYACSFGAILSVVFALEYKWEWMDDYFIKRPWNQLVNIKTEDVFNLFNVCGIVDERLTYNVFSPLFKAKGFKEDITLKEFYENTKKEIHIFSSNMNDASGFMKEDISHITYPNLPVYKAVYMSLTIPGIMKPICDNGKYYLDGGFINHFPISDCLKDNKIEETIGIHIKGGQIKDIDSNTTLSTVYLNLLFKLSYMRNKCEWNGNEDKKNIINHTFNSDMWVVDWMKVMDEQNVRCHLISKGLELANEFIKDNGYSDVSKN